MKCVTTLLLLRSLQMIDHLNNIYNTFTYKRLNHLVLFSAVHIVQTLTGRGIDFVYG